MPTQRKLVTLRTVTHVRRMKGPRHKSYDVATIAGGWPIVVNHGAYTAGQRIVYFEIDSFVPNTTSLFTWEDNIHMTDYQGQRGLHVRSQMFGAQLSQGMVQPLRALPEVKAVLDGLEAEHGADKAWQIARGMAFEDRLGVTKWEVPWEVRGRVLGEVPQFFPRPACDRAQNSCHTIFSRKYLDTVFQITEKLDGVSMTVYRIANGSKWNKALPALPAESNQQDDGARVGVASAGEDLDERCNNEYWQAAKRAGLPAKLHKMSLKNVAVQGELIGPSIKNNSLGFAEDADHEFIVFQIFDIDKQKMIPATDMVTVCEELGLAHVPVVGYVRLRDFATSLEEILEKAEGVGSYGGTREGFVFKSMGDDFAFKVISNKWLLEQGE